MAPRWPAKAPPTGHLAPLALGPFATADETRCASWLRQCRVQDAEQSRLSRWSGGLAFAGYFFKP